MFSFPIIFACFASLCQSQEVPFGNGETFQYQIKWNIFSGGKMSLLVNDDVYLDGERAFHLQANTETEGMFHKFYPFKAKVESFVSKSDFLPLRYQYSSWMPDETRLEVTSFPRGQLQGQYHLDSYKKGKEKEKDEKFAISAFFQDPLSILYYVRTQDLTVGDQIDVSLSSDQKDFKILVKVLRKTKIRVMGKVWDAFVLEPGLSLGGLPFSPGSLWMWVSADEAKIPLYFSGRSGLGVISATLIKMKRSG